jgi:hypothetical protein
MADGDDRLTELPEAVLTNLWTHSIDGSFSMAAPPTQNSMKQQKTFFDTR